MRARARGFRGLKRLYRPLKSCVFTGLQIVCFQRSLKGSSCLFKGPSKTFSAFTFLRVRCFTCCVASSPSHSLPTSLLSSLPPELARARTRQSCDACTPTLAFPAFWFEMKLYMQCCISVSANEMTSWQKRTYQSKFIQNENPH